MPVKVNAPIEPQIINHQEVLELAQSKPESNLERSNIDLIELSRRVNEVLGGREFT